MSRASNLAGFTTSISPPTNLSVGIITAISFFGSGSGLTGVGLGTTGSINTSGIITATSFFGSGANLTGVSAGIGTTGSINTSGIITATSFFGNGSGLTGVAATTLTIGAGTAAAPSISPTGDSNTGIFFPSADTVAISEGGAEALRVDSSGRLLVGTTSSPRSGLLQIVQANSPISSSNSNTGIYSNNAQAIDIGGMLALGGQSGEVNWLYGSVSGRSENNGYAGYLQFGSSIASGSHLEAMRISGTQELLIGTTTRNANGGVLQLKSGITFPATAVAASDANTLDDYEEGAWTPTFNFGATSGSGTGVTYSYQDGRYTKIGRSVVCTGEVALTNKGSSTGIFRITGWPFTNGASRAAVIYGNVNSMSSTGFIQSFIEGNATYTNNYSTSTAGTQSQVINTDLSNTTHLQFTVTFQV